MEKKEKNSVFYYKKAKAEKLYNQGNYEMAFRLYLELAGTEDPAVLFMVGDMYHYGQGTEVNFQQARVYYEMAIERKDLRARCYLALMYYKGEGVERDPLTAKRLLDANSEIDIHSLDD